MKLFILGQKQEQSQLLISNLDKLKQFEIIYIDFNNNKDVQLQAFKNKNHKDLKLQNNDLIYEIPYFNPQNQVQGLIDRLKNQKLQNFRLILLINNNYDKRFAEKINNQLNFNFNEVKIIELVQYFNEYKNFEVNDVKQKEIALFISDNVQIQTQIIEKVSTQLMLEKQRLMNSPEFDLNSDFDKREQCIESFKKIFQRFQCQLSIFFIIIEYQRFEMMKKNFINIFSHLKNFSTKIIVLIHNNDHKIEEEDDQIIRKYFLQTAKIRNMYYFTNSQLSDKYIIAKFFQNILQEQSNISDVGIDLTGTIFEIQDEYQLQQERDQFSLGFQKQSLEQKCLILKQDIENGNLNIEDLDNQIRELQKRKYELEQKRKNDQYELTKKQRELKNIQNQFDQVESNLNKIAQQKTQVLQQQTQVIQQQTQIIQNSPNVKVESQIQDVKIDNFRNQQNEIEQLKSRNKNLQFQMNRDLEEQEKIRSKQLYQQKNQKNYQNQYYQNQNHSKNIDELEKKIANSLSEIEENNQKILQLEQEDNYQNKKHQQEQPQQCNPSSNRKYQKNSTNNYQSKYQQVS